MFFVLSSLFFYIHFPIFQLPKPEKKLPKSSKIKKPFEALKASAAFFPEVCQV
jgi:hypothetical protein